jgi:hypothetical protein
MVRDALERLLQFPYFDNYLELSLLEWRAAGLSAGSKILFVGGGPFPLTALCFAYISLADGAGRLEDMARMCGENDRARRRESMLSILESLSASAERARATTRITVIEQLQDACERARSGTAVLGIADIVTSVCCKGEEYTFSGKIDALVIASMVRNKRGVLENLLNQIPSTQEVRVVLRSVERSSMKELFYEPLEESDLPDPTVLGQQRLHTIVPPPGSPLLNSVEVFLKPSS